MDVKDIIKDVLTISENTTFKDALATMLSGKTNSLVVTDSDGKICGEVSVVDLMDAIVPDYLDGDNIAAHFATDEMFKEAVTAAADKEVQYFMSKDYSTVSTNDSLMAVSTIALGHQRARIPVVDGDNKPVGIISRQGLKHIIAEFLEIKETD